ncbi:hypothetical protein [Amycolatopsis sp. NPDC000740]
MWDYLAARDDITCIGPGPSVLAEGPNAGMWRVCFRAPRGLTMKVAAR